MKKYAGRMIYMMLIAFAGGIVFSACSSSKLEDVWKDKQYNFGSVKKVVVISALGDQAQRQMWEDSFVNVFSSYGIKAEPSYKYYPDAIPKPSVISSFVNNNYDGVVLIRKIKEGTGEVDAAGADYQIPVGWVHYSLYNRYKKVYKNASEINQSENSGTVTYNVGLYRTNIDGDLIWEGTDVIYAPVSQNALTREVKDVVVPEMINSRTTQG